MANYETIILTVIVFVFAAIWPRHTELEVYLRHCK
jgi:hypothetical protein